MYESGRVLLPRCTSTSCGTLGTNRFLQVPGVVERIRDPAFLDRSRSPRWTCVSCTLLLMAEISLRYASAVSIPTQYDYALLLPRWTSASCKTRPANRFCFPLLVRCLISLCVPGAYLGSGVRTADTRTSASGTTTSANRSLHVVERVRAGGPLAMRECLACYEKSPRSTSASCKTLPASQRSLHLLAVCLSILCAPELTSVQLRAVGHHENVS